MMMMELSCSRLLVHPACTKLRVERIVAWANLTPVTHEVTPVDCWPGIAARRCNARSIAELATGTTPSDPLIASVHADMLALGFVGGLLDMESVVHSDRRKRERPAREAEALKSIDNAHDDGISGGEQSRARDRAMPERLLAAEVSDATSNWWNATHLLEPKSARRWARLWGNHSLRDRECPIPGGDIDDEDSADDEDELRSETELDADDGDDDAAPAAQTVRAWRKKLCAAALAQQRAAWLEQRENYTASHGG